MTQAALRDFKTACVNGGRLFRCTRQGGDSTASIMARRKGREREKERTEMKEYVRFKSIKRRDRRTRSNDGRKWLPRRKANGHAGAETLER